MSHECSDRLTINSRERVWRMIAEALQDPDPTPEHEARYGGTNMDPATLSLNTVRGEAMHCAVKYGLWVRDSLVEEARARGFEEMPELRAALEERLRDPSLAVRAVFGQWLPWLISLDHGWVQNNLPVIFPVEGDSEPLWAAAWNTYVSFCSLYKTPFTLLDAQYRTAVERIGNGSRAATRLYDPDRRLAEHIAMAIGLGWDDLSPASLAGLFFSTAPPELRRHAMLFAGESVCDDEVPEAVIARFTTLWNHRRGMPPEELRGELGGFGSWYVSGCFPEAWALEELLFALQVDGEVEWPDRVVKRLAERGQDNPSKAVVVLTAILQGDRHGWHAYAWRTEIEDLLKKATTEHVTAEAEALINWLGQRGHHEYRHLLPNPRAD